MVSINFKIMNKNAQLNMAYSAFRDDRAAKKKKRFKEYSQTSSFNTQL